MVPAAAPRWNWTDLSSEEYRERLEDLAGWVAWLVDSYGEWVELPPCWPVHEALRAELSFFCYWNRRIMRLGRDPSEGLRWHLNLRAAAVQWRSLSACRHEPEASAARRRRDQRRAAVLAHAAMAQSEL